MAAVLHVMPIRPGRGDDLRAFVAELRGPRRVEWAESHRRHGITRQAVFVGGHDGRSFAFMLSEAEDPERALRSLASSGAGFDRWMAGRMSELLEERLAVETLADTAPRRGPWRGWRRWRG